MPHVCDIRRKHHNFYEIAIKIRILMAKILKNDYLEKNFNLWYKFYFCKFSAFKSKKT